MTMANSPTIQLNDVVKRLNTVFRGGSGQKQKDFLKKMGLASIDMIVTRTRKGFGVARTGGNRKKLARLSKSYIDFRKKNRRRLSRLTSPTKSNLTFTAQMLDSVKILKSNDRGFEIGSSGRRSDGKRNADVSRWVSAKRPFMNLGRKEITDLTKFMEKEFRDRIKKQF